MKRKASKKPAAARRKQEHWLDWEDAVNTRCRNLDTLAQLLAYGGEALGSPEVVANTGALIVRELEQLRALLENRP